MSKTKQLQRLAAKAERGTAKRRELHALAKAAGAAIDPAGKRGSNHDNVVHNGHIISQIPRSDPVSRGVQKALVIALKVAGLISIMVFVMWWVYATWVM